MLAAWYFYIIFWLSTKALYPASKGMSVIRYKPHVQKTPTSWLNSPLNLQWDLSSLPHRTSEEVKVSAQPSPFGPRLDMSCIARGITHWAELSRGHPEEKTVWDFLGAVWGPPSRPHVGCVQMAALVSLCHALWGEERKQFFLFLMHLTYQFGLEVELPV